MVLKQYNFNNQIPWQVTEDTINTSKTMAVTCIAIQSYTLLSFSLSCQAKYV